MCTFARPRTPEGLTVCPSGTRAYLSADRSRTEPAIGRESVDGFGAAAERVSYENLLERELRALDPELVITFGGNAWPALRRSTTPVPVMETDADPGSIMSIHGTLHEISDPIDAHVLPLAHMSGQVWWRFPPDEYISRLSAALDVFARRALR